MAKKNVLIVDDNTVLRNTLVLFFKMKGFEVFSFESSEEVQNFLLSESVSKVDLAIIDYNLADNADGLKLARILERQYGAVKIILVSGFFPSNIVSSVKRKNFKLLSKPFDIYELTDVLRQMDFIDS